MDTVFVQLRVKGAVSLYERTDRAGRSHFFYVDHARSPELVELMFHQYRNPEAAETVKNAILENSHYKRQLSQLFIALPQLDAEDFNSLDYHLASLQKLMVKANDLLVPEGAVYVSEKKKIHAYFRALAGTSHSWIGLRGEQATSFIGSSPDVGLGAMLGIGGEFVLPYRQRKQSITADVLYHRRVYRGNLGTDGNSVYDVPVNSIQSNIATQFRLNQHDIAPFLGLGAAVIASLDEQLSYWYSTSAQQIIEGVVTDNVDYGFLIKGGIAARDLSVELSYNHFRKIDIDNSSMGGGEQAFTLMVMYRLRPGKRKQ